MSGQEGYTSYVLGATAYVRDPETGKEVHRGTITENNGWSDFRVGDKVVSIGQTDDCYVTRLGTVHLFGWIIDEDENARNRRDAAIS